VTGFTDHWRHHRLGKPTAKKSGCHQRQGCVYWCFVTATSSDKCLELDKLTTFEPDWLSLKEAVDENPFIHTGVELLKCAGTNVIYLASIRPPQPLGRDSAIRCGLLMRGCKLAIALVRDACRDRGILQLALSRQLTETLANLRYLCNDESGERHAAYVMDSLISEREFLKNVERHAQAAGGQERGVEKRIRHSIERTAVAAGVDLSTLPSRKDIGWPSIERRIELAYGTTAYSAYRVGSDVLHGGWNDLLRNHLREVDGGFEPEYDPQPVRPQALITAAVQVAEAGLDYLGGRSDGERSAFVPTMAALVGYALRTNDLHDQWLDQPDDAQRDGASQKR
jgi:hypothetical protein